MRILLDECLPRRLKAHLAGNACRTIPEAGWRANGMASCWSWRKGATTCSSRSTRGVGDQQNLRGRGIAIVILRARSNRLEDLLERVPACLAAMERFRPGEVILVSREGSA